MASRSAALEQADRGQHPGVRLGARDIVSVEPLVEADRGVYLLHERGRAALEVTAPQIDAARARGALRGCRSRPGPEQGR